METQYIAGLRCLVGGDGPPVFVIHGGPGLGYDYLLPGMVPLQNIGSCTFYDQAGCGDTDEDILQDNDPLSTYINDIESLRKAGGHKKITLLAHSWGGFLAAQYAHVHPQCVAGLIFMSSVPLSTDDYANYMTCRTGRISDVQDELAILKTPETASRYLHTLFRPYFYEQKMCDQLHTQMSEKAAENSFKIYDHFRATIMKKPFDLYSVAKENNLPCLILHGEHDPIPLKYPKKLHTAAPHSKLNIIKDCGHFPYIEQPDELFAHITSFIHPHDPESRGRET